MPKRERRDESDESLYESADGHSDAVSASDDALPGLGSATPTLSKESLKIAVTDEENDLVKNKRGHRKTMSLSNPLEIVKSLGDDWFENKKEPDKHSEKKKSRESLWSEDDRDSVHGSNLKLDQLRKNSKKEDKNKKNNEMTNSRKSGKSSSVSALNFLRRKKTPIVTVKAVEVVAEVVDKVVNSEELISCTKFFLEEETRHTCLCERKRIADDTDSEEEPPATPRTVIANGEYRRRLSRQTSRSKSKVRGKSQTVRVNTLRKSHSGTLRKGKKKNSKTPVNGRSRQASLVDATPIPKKKIAQASKQNSWLFSSYRAELAAAAGGRISNDDDACAGDSVDVFGLGVDSRTILKLARAVLSSSQLADNGSTHLFSRILRKMKYDERLNVRWLSAHKRRLAFDFALRRRTRSSSGPRLDWSSTRFRLPPP
ncbi:hypothetical protein EVAR_62482_1 [Eumeta japonica]|uniref:Uncharacterized protein n=1 Tax=Eumeta variegata TaxID=151549 RepID=A0A4C1ZN60_EUMVA|nr:hypothetical protein EVAR_62482_1 [Eumeta japonica]